jgi:hypothetical protein
VPERPDRGHVRLAEAPVGLDQHGHLPTVSTFAVGHPAQVHHAVHRAVGDLAGPLVVGQVERAERERAELRAPFETGGHAVAQRGDGVFGVVPAK